MKISQVKGEGEVKITTIVTSEFENILEVS